MVNKKSKKYINKNKVNLVFYNIIKSINMFDYYILKSKINTLDI